MNWYYIDESITSDDRRQGPFSKEDILELAERKIITEETLIWHTGLADWKLWKELKVEIEKEQANVIIQQTLEALIQEKKLQVKQNQFAGFWIRALAYSIDICILTIIACITMMLLHYTGLLDTAAISAFFSLSPEELQDNDKLLELFQARGMQLFLWLTSITQFLYFFLCNWKFDATPGKLLLKIKIIRADGTRLGLTGSLLRFFCASLSSFSFVYLYGLAYIVALVDPEKRTFHDWVAKTRVVYKNSEK